MKARDLHETISTWRTLYTSISEPGRTRNVSDEMFHEKWNKGMLKVVASLGLIDEIRSTPVEKHMLKAVEDGRSHDVKRLDDIYVLLGEVEIFIEERLLS